MGPRTQAAVVCGMLVVLGGCIPSGPVSTSPPASDPSSTPTSAPPSAAPRDDAAAPAQSPPPPGTRGLVYVAGPRARTGELLLFAEQTSFAGRKDLLAAARAATSGAPADPDHTSLWRTGAPVAVRLWWDGDEGYYDVRLPDVRSTERPAGTTMREAHLAIQQVVWTLQSVGGIAAPVRFHVGRRGDPVTDLLGVPATGPGATYLAADHGGVLSRVDILAPAEGARVQGEVALSGLAESFEGTVAIRAFDESGRRVHDDSATAEQCCGRLWPWRHVLDTSGWEPGTYVVQALTDDPVGIDNGSDGPEIDTRTIVVR
ncbi:Gmad2 immunoglobulin-like domain-containing protein [Nocardioides hwasunensis]|uniref:Bacterial spore germination immunoglobulin-like domain-containing protein n=1 Tax=Nocardioides hwasunensis TaxID=397258 RepID=A0ABR8MJ43_9ACTN|nr:Gmad2 immunoglobulin-like domain-containing protein [Nocardioides hwasunensis]MBD3914504.1 hypothetical protein [Nocardioides hwasunensis]